METVNRYWHILLHVFGSMEAPAEENDLKAEKQRLLASPECADSLSARILYYHILYAERMMQHKLPEAIAHLSALIRVC